MISELIQYAELIEQTGREPFRSRKIDWLIDLDSDGKVIGFVRTISSTKPSRRLLAEGFGKAFIKTPANYLLGSPNDSNWRPDLLSGPVSEIFPAGVDGNSIYRFSEILRARRSAHKKRFPDRLRLKKIIKWRQLVFECAKALPNNQVVAAIANFIRDVDNLNFGDLPISSTGERLERLLKSFRDGNETLSFRVEGTIAVTDPEILNWWAKGPFLQIIEDEEKKCVGIGGDGFQSGVGKLTSSSPSVFGNVPLVSFNSECFESYGLGHETARLRLDSVEKAAAAMNALGQDADANLSLGDEKACFWAVQNDQVLDCSFLNLLDTKDSLQVADFLNSVWGGLPRELDHSAFHVAVLKKGTGRFSVRSWEVGSLGEVDRRLREYFEAIRLPTGKLVNLNTMALATIQKTKKGSKTKPTNLTYNSLFETAWRGTPLPHRLLSATISRQYVEIAKGRSEDDKGEFETRLRARTALIKLYFYSNQKEPKDHPMNEQHHDKQDHPAYLCGRVLALLDKIHNAAHRKTTASSPADRYYGSASSTPALVFPRLCKLARIHLEKIEIRGWAYNLDRDLADLVSKFSSQATWPRMLSLEDQGRFAIGFYYERVSKASGEVGQEDEQTIEVQDSNNNEI